MSAIRCVYMTGAVCMTGAHSGPKIRNIRKLEINLCTVLLVGGFKSTRYCVSIQSFAERVYCTYSSERVYCTLHIAHIALTMMFGTWSSVLYIGVWRSEKMASFIFALGLLLTWNNHNVKLVVPCLWSWYWALDGKKIRRNTVSWLFYIAPKAAVKCQLSNNHLLWLPLRAKIKQKRDPQEWQLLYQESSYP